MFASTLRVKETRRGAVSFTDSSTLSLSESSSAASSASAPVLEPSRCGGFGGGTIRNMFNNFITDFSVSPVVIVRSKRLRIPQIVLFMVVLVLVLVYFVRDLRYLKVNAADLTVSLQVQKPATNWWNCTFIQQSCISHWPSSHPSYCERHRCANFTIHDVRPREQIAASEVAVALSQNRCTNRGRSDKCLSPEEVLVNSPEDLTLRVRASEKAVDTIDFDAVRTQSLLKYKDGTIKRLPALNRSQDDEAYDPLSQLEFFKDKYNETCGLTTGGRGTCMGTAWGDYISLSVLLDAAGVNLTDEIRLRGIRLELDIEFTNMDVADYWTRPWGIKRKVVYQVREIRFIESDTWSFSEVRSSSDGQQISEVTKVLLVTAFGRGIVGEYTPYRFLTELAVMSTVLALITTIVQHVVARLYFLCGLRHVFLLQQLASTTETPECHELADIGMDRQTLAQFVKENTRPRGFAGMATAAAQAGGDTGEAAEEFGLAELLLPAAM